MSSIGPDGTRGLTIPSGDQVRISGVGIGVDDVAVVLGERGISGWFITVRAMLNRKREWEVSLQGGNTQRGDIAAYEEATRVYQEAVLVAKRLVNACADPLALFEGYDYDTLPVIAVSLPDYMLGVFLLDQNVPVLYERGNDAVYEVMHLNRQNVDLATLRVHAAERAEAKLRQKSRTTA